jgi:hypothetical protein
LEDSARRKAFDIDRRVLTEHVATWSVTVEESLERATREKKPDFGNQKKVIVRIGGASRAGMMRRGHAARRCILRPYAASIA